MGKNDMMGKNEMMGIKKMGKMMGKNESKIELSHTLACMSCRKGSMLHGPCTSQLSPEAALLQRAPLWLLLVFQAPRRTRTSLSAFSRVAVTVVSGLNKYNMNHII